MDDAPPADLRAHTTRGIASSTAVLVVPSGGTFIWRRLRCPFMATSTAGVVAAWLRTSGIRGSAVGLLSQF